MSNNKLKALVLLGCVLAAPSSWAISAYSQNFDGLNASGATALSDDGWNVGANVYDGGGNFLYNYFTFPAPNGGAAFSAVASGEGGTNQGTQQLSIYNDYNNGDHAVGNTIQALVFQETTVGSSDLGLDSVFSFDSKAGNIEGASTTRAFMKVIDSVGGSFATLGEVTYDTTSIGTDWVEDIALTLNIDSSWNGQLLQFGFLSEATNYEGSGIFYDNVSLNVVPIPAAAWLFASGLGMLGWARRRSSK